jgi:hypothetical protein
MKHLIGARGVPFPQINNPLDILLFFLFSAVPKRTRKAEAKPRPFSKGGAKQFNIIDR